MKFVDLCPNDIDTKSLFRLFVRLKHQPRKDFIAFSTFYNRYKYTPSKETAIERKNIIKKEKTEGFNLGFLKSNMLFRAEALLF